ARRLRIEHVTGRQIQPSRLELERDGEWTIAPFERPYRVRPGSPRRSRGKRRYGRLRRNRGTRRPPSWSRSDIFRVWVSSPGQTEFRKFPGGWRRKAGLGPHRGTTKVARTIRRQTVVS